MTLSIEQRFALIARNTEEIVTEKELKELLKKKEKPVVYLGTAITGRPHVAYFLWVLKLSDFLKAGFMDGIPGLLVSVLSAYHVFSKYAKLWENQSCRPA